MVPQLMLLSLTYQFPCHFKDKKEKLGITMVLKCILSYPQESDLLKPRFVNRPTCVLLPDTKSCIGIPGSSGWLSCSFITSSRAGCSVMSFCKQKVRDYSKSSNNIILFNIVSL